jgi:hypothetical protein
VHHRPLYSFTNTPLPSREAGSFSGQTLPDGFATMVARPRQFTQLPNTDDREFEPVVAEDQASVGSSTVVSAGLM